MIPAGFVLLNALPLTPNGKLDRCALSKLQHGQELEESGRAPCTPVEEIIAGTWAEVLGLDRVSANANFFDLGGHSLLATQAVSRLRESLRIQLPLRAIFEAPTVEALARRIKQEMSPERELQRQAIPPVPRDQALPLSYAQDRLWVLSQLAPDAAYNLPFVFHLRGPLDVKAFEQALRLLIRRHELLRTGFINLNGSPQQVVQATGDFSLSVTDLRQTEKEEEQPTP
jgi:acyl carrier protein